MFTYSCLILVQLATNIWIIEAEHGHRPSGNVLTEIVQNQENVQKYETLLILSAITRTDYCAEEFVYEGPKIELTEERVFNVKTKFNSKLLIIVCLRPVQKNTMLKALAVSLNGIRSTRVIILMQEADEVGENFRATISEIFSYCQQEQMLNVAIVIGDSEYYYTYELFPNFKIVRRIFEEQQNIFANKLNNLQGHPLYTYPDQLHPRTLLYRDAQQELVMIGYIGRLLTTFAQNLNATMRYAYPVKIGESVFFTEIMEWLLEGRIDIPASIACMNDMNTSTVDAQLYTRFIEISQWFPMLPVAKKVPPRNIYGLMLTTRMGISFVVFYFGFATTLTVSDILHTQSFKIDTLLELLINVRVLLGLLGRSFKSRTESFWSGKILAGLLVYMGLSINTIYDTLLRTYLIHTPRTREIESFDDIKRLKLKILELAAAPKLLKTYTSPQFMQKYSSLVQIKQNISEFIELRNSWNTSYAYGVTSAIWSIYERKQRYFQQRLFRTSERVTFANFMIYGLPLPKNSIYEQALNTYIARLHASGILKFWYYSSFSDMIQVGLMSFEDYSTKKVIEEARVQDFFWIWLLFAIGIAASAIMFAIEVITFKVSLRKNFKFKWRI